MLSLLKRYSYKNEVLGSVLALLGQPDKKFLQLLLKGYPGIKGAVKSNYEKGTSADYAAVMIAVSVLEDQLDKLASEARKRLLENPESSTEAQRCSWFLSLVEQWESDRKVPEGTVEKVSRDLADALCVGNGFEERSKRRIEEALFKALKIGGGSD